MKVYKVHLSSTGYPTLEVWIVEVIEGIQTIIRHTKTKKEYDVFFLMSCANDFASF